MMVLGIETSCDETAAAVVEGSARILSSVVATQEELHAPFGGVVPEVASRAHCERITSIVSAAVERAGVSPRELGGLAVTSRPGLIGSLLVGVTAAKALALAWDLPLAAVDHVQAHVYSCALAGAEWPFAALVASGGHTSLYRADGPTAMRLLGRTVDDAAGEAFDKVAAILGLGFPGGPAVSRAAGKGDGSAVSLPRPMAGSESLDFSFSGLKTAVLYHVKAIGGAGALSDKARADVAASFERSVADVLVSKLFEAARRESLGTVAVGGGVAANRRLREAAAAEGRRLGVRVVFPEPGLCTDNAAMVAGLGHHLLAAGADERLTADASARSA
jgi:N6-L-threonylcarbamoyladenine synthase